MHLWACHWWYVWLPLINENIYIFSYPHKIIAIKNKKSPDEPMLWPFLPVLKVLFVISLAYWILAWGKTLRKDSDLRATTVLETDA